MYIFHSTEYILHRRVLIKGLLAIIAALISNCSIETDACFKSNPFCSRMSSLKLGSERVNACPLDKDQRGAGSASFRELLIYQ